VANPVSQRPRLFNFDAQGIRVLGSWESPIFVGKDVCDALGYSKYRDALALLEDDERVSSVVDTLGGAQEMTCVTESGLYALAFGSRKPQARLFRRWVTGEVLPAIRRSGAYHAAPAAAPAPAPAAVPPALPPSPTLDGHVAHVLLAAIAFPRDHGLVHPVEIARAAVVEGRFTELCDDPADPVKVSRLLRFFQGRGFFQRWLRAERGWLVFCEPMGRNRHRRYSITTRREGGAA
jgi:hypothetical protein